MGMEIYEKSKKEIGFPNSMIFTYDRNNTNKSESSKNVYQGYLMSAEKRSSSEKQFEKYCESAKSVDLLYLVKNKWD